MTAMAEGKTEYDPLKAEGIIRACPDTDWSTLGDSFRMAENQYLIDWWNNRVEDI